MLPLRLLLILFVISSTTSICSNAKDAFQNYLGTKTPYRTVANHNSSKISYDGCEAKKMWAVIRHGTRNPTAEFIEKMRIRLGEIRDLIVNNASSKIGNTDLDLFRTWSVKITNKDAKKLTHEGEDELLLLAERLQNRFPEILGKIYSETAFKFKFTATQRTKKSAAMFATGLFGRGVVKDIKYPEPLRKDPILRFYKMCEKWRKDVKKNSAALTQLNNFYSSEVMNKTRNVISARLGLTNELSMTDIHTMYMTCAFETSWNNRRRSPWCSAFSIDDFKVLEYGEDLKYFWVDGYGYELTYKQACPAFNDLIQFFTSKDTYPKATVYFTHSGTLLKMLAFFKLYTEDKLLLAKDFKENIDRNWRVSKIDPFATNLAFVLYDCQGHKKVVAFHQEEVLNLPSCPNSDLCDLGIFTEYYGGNTECLFNEMCEI